jgi:histidinol-phosphate/aromatic aminotransferase/cobyric acid decarboxylase-like protein
VSNVYFELTRELNRVGPVAVLSSGQAAFAQEVDELQQADRRRVAAYQQAAARYLDEFRRMKLDAVPLERAHDEACRLAGALLPERPPGV